MAMAVEDGSLPTLLKAFVTLLFICIPADALQSDIDCLKAVKNSLKDPLNVLGNWNFNNKTEGYICGFVGVECWHQLENKVLNIRLSSMKLEGNFPIGLNNCVALTGVDISNNNLYGSIPSNVSKVVGFATSLDISSNNFSGTIPKGLANCTNLNSLKLDDNQFSGQIPLELGSLSRLKAFSVANNRLSGPVPSFGPNATISADNYANNLDLCGGPLPACKDPAKKSQSGIVVGAAISGGTFGTLALIIVIFFFFRKVSKKRDDDPDGNKWTKIMKGIKGIKLLYVYHKHRGDNLHQHPEHALHDKIRISYHVLLHGTNGFSEGNFLGSGSFGKVYKGILFDGTIVAVKLLNLTVDGAFKSFDAECKVLRTIRHRNLVKIISTCTNPELRALILEYIPNGSLEKWLYSHNYCLSFLQRVNIMIDVGVALEYLHFGQSEQVIHCDLKPSNVLLDEDMVAHVGDFGIAKILAANKDDTLTSILGSFGYIAPEYGTEGRVSRKGDTYSFGIMLLETFTRKKPTDDMFSEDLSLRQWVSSSVNDGILNVVDENLLNENVRENYFISFQSNLSAILDLGLGCSRDSPKERFEMKDVVAKLNKIKLRIISEEVH